MNSTLKLCRPAILFTLGILSSHSALARSSQKTKAAELAGATLFRDHDCAHCHGAAGIGGKKGPALTDLRKQKQWKPARITRQILDGGQKMPPFREALTDEETAQLVAYLRAKHKPEPPAAPAAP